jgi:DNA-binding NarL/FixJ family response regulator
MAGLFWQPYLQQLNMERATVMIIDDHTLTREIWATALGFDKRYEVVAATGDGKEAAEIARQKRPQLVLLDINMEPMSGFQVLAQIRKYAPGSKVIGVSMYSQPVYARKLLREGAKGYVTKSSPRAELMQAMEDVLAGKTYICKEVRDIVKYLSDSPDASEHVAAINLLSAREIEIIGYIRQGLSSKEIGARIFITPQTVEVHRHNILKKLKLKNAAALIQFISNAGW